MSEELYTYYKYSH